MKAVPLKQFLITKSHACLAEIRSRSKECRHVAQEVHLKYSKGLYPSNQEVKDWLIQLYSRDFVLPRETTFILIITSTNDTIHVSASIPKAWAYNDDVKEAYKVCKDLDDFLIQLVKPYSQNVESTVEIDGHGKYAMVSFKNIYHDKITGNILGNSIESLNKLLGVPETPEEESVFNDDL
jgi:hypothetical protein